MIRENLAIELARLSDAAPIARISRDEIERGLGWSWTRERVARAVRSRETNVVVARHRNRLAGFGIMRYGYDRAELDLLAVTGRHRRRGLGRRVVDWLTAVAVTAGLRRVDVQLRETNGGAAAFYRSLGFHEVKRIPGYYRGRETAFLMTRRSGAGVAEGQRVWPAAPHFPRPPGER